jgi:hypothetical protein
MGEVRLEDEDLGIQSACLFHIYKGAVAILAMKTLEARRAAIARLPEAIRPHVEAEARRLFDKSRSR